VPTPGDVLERSDDDEKGVFGWTREKSWRVERRRKVKRGAPESTGTEALRAEVLRELELALALALALDHLLSTIKFIEH
jgi:hypothetical protein